ncbi:MAG: winged helix-turn-helix domain-containing protein [Sporolactobacillus sp.]|jgi:DNA-binding transcriptional ArsR family regulator|nr:winged helix-turn-helix domain-containing protein [Sporolactobacillus sp.]
MMQSNIAVVASCISGSSRATMLAALLDGRFHPASELAYKAGIKPQTASFHLAKMTQAHILTMKKEGRHRYYGISDPKTASVLESLLSVAPSPKINSFRQAAEEKAIRHARTCYDHLAGSLGVKIADALLKNELIGEDKKQFFITEQGKKFFDELHIDLQALHKKRRAFARKCLDWSERRYHIAGAVGNALLDRLLELNWIQRSPHSRAVEITAKGKIGFKNTFSIDINQLSSKDES